MANEKISDLTASTLQSTDSIPVSRGTTATYKANLNNRSGDETMTGKLTVNGDQETTGTTFVSQINIDNGNGTIDTDADNNPVFSNSAGAQLTLDDNTAVINNTLRIEKHGTANAASLEFRHVDGGAGVDATITSDASDDALNINNAQQAPIRGVISSNTVFEATYDGTDTKFDVTNLETEALKVTGGTPGAGKVLKSDAAGNATWQTDSTGGDVTGPSTSADSNIAAFDGTTGKIIKDGGIATSDIVTTSSTSTLTNKTIEAANNNVVMATVELADVSATSPTDGQVLKYNSTSGKYEPSTDEDSGTVTSVGLVNTGGLTVSGSPVTTSGNISVGLDSATQTLLGDIPGKAPLASPALTGTPTAPTAAQGDNSTKIATTAYVDAQVSPNNKGFYATPALLRSAYPTGQDGWYAIVGTTDTFWVWDSGITDWKDTDSNSLGTVTSIGITSSDLTVTNSPVTTSGSIGLDIANGLNAAKIADGSVSNTEFQYINSLSSNAQTQIDSKISATSTDTLQNKTISASNNTLSIATSDLSDFDSTAPTNGQVPKWDSTSSKWVPSADSNSGTVTSIGITNTNGLTVSGSPVTSSGSISVGLDTATQNTLSQVSTNTTDIASKAPLVSPAFTGAPTAPTQSASDNSTKIATTAYVDAAASVKDELSELSDVMITTPSSGDNLIYDSLTSIWKNKSISGAITTDSDGVTTLASGIDATKLADGSVSNTQLQYINSLSSDAQAQIDAKAPIASPTFTGTATIPSVVATNFRLGSSATAGYVLKADASGNGTWQSNTQTEGVYKIVRATGGDYATVYAAVQAGEKYLFVDALDADITESNDIVSSGASTLTDDLFIVLSGTWKPKRILIDASSTLSIKSGNGTFSGKVQPQIPSSSLESHFFGKSSSTGTESNTVILNGIVIDNSAMTADEYGQVAATGNFFTQDVKVILPNYKGNGLSWSLTGINNPGQAYGTTWIVGGGSSCASSLITGDALSIEHVYFQGEFIKNGSSTQVSNGNALIFGWRSDFHYVTIEKVSWALTNISTTDVINFRVDGNIKNIPAPSTRTNTVQCRLFIDGAGSDREFSNIDFNAGGFISFINGSNIKFNNCRNLGSFYPDASNTSAEKWSFTDCILDKNDGTSVFVEVSGSLFSGCTFTHGLNFQNNVKNIMLSNCKTSSQLTTLASSATPTDTQLSLTSTNGIFAGQVLTIHDGLQSNEYTISTITGNNVTLTSSLGSSYVAGDAIGALSKATGTCEGLTMIGGNYQGPIELTSSNEVIINGARVCDNGVSGVGNVCINLAKVTAGNNYVVTSCILRGTVNTGTATNTQVSTNVSMV